MSGEAALENANAVCLVQASSSLSQVLWSSSCSVYRRKSH